MLGTLPLAFAAAFLLARRRADQLLQRLAIDSPRDLAEMKILVPDTPLFEGALSELAANDLGRPRRLLGERLDIERSVDATARAAGAPQFVFEMRSVTPFYAVFIEEAGRHDHLARLADVLVDRLTEAGVLTERYYMLTSGLVRTRRGWHLSLKEAADLHRDDRILLLGPGESVIDDQRRKLVDALSRDARWADRAYLVLGRIDALTARLLTDEGFALAPATPAGVRALGRHIASAPREIGEVLVSVPGLQRDPARRPLPTTSETKLTLADVRLRLIHTLRAPLQQLTYLVGRRFSDVEEVEQTYANEEIASAAPQDRPHIGLVLNRTVLRDFLAKVGRSDRKGNVLVVNGPPGSGKSFTIEIARRSLGNRVRVVTLDLQMSSTLDSVVRDIHAKLGAEHNMASTEVQPSNRVAYRYANEIRERIVATSDTDTLVIFHNEGVELQPEITNLIVNLIREPGSIYYIVIGIDASQFVSTVAVEDLQEFTEWEVRDELERFARDMHLPRDVVDPLLREVASIGRGDRYNARIGAALQSILAHLPA
jgi:hypothetical protein